MVALPPVQRTAHPPGWSADRRPSQTGLVDRRVTSTGVGMACLSLWSDTESAETYMPVPDREAQTHWAAALAHLARIHRLRHRRSAVRMRPRSFRRATTWTPSPARRALRRTPAWARAEQPHRDVGADRDVHPGGHPDADRDGDSDQYPDRGQQDFYAARGGGEVVAGDGVLHGGDGGHPG